MPLLIASSNVRTLRGFARQQGRSWSILYLQMMKGKEMNTLPYDKRPLVATWNALEQ